MAFVSVLSAPLRAVASTRPVQAAQAQADAERAIASSQAANENSAAATARNSVAHPTAFVEKEPPKSVMAPRRYHRLKINDGNDVIVLALERRFPARIQVMTSPGLVIAGRWRAGSGAAGGGWPPAGPHRPGAAGQPPCVGERAAEQEFDLGVGAAQFVAGPLGQGVVDGGVQPQQDALAFGHRGSVAAITGRGCRC